MNLSSILDGTYAEMADTDNAETEREAAKREAAKREATAGFCVECEDQPRYSPLTTARCGASNAATTSARCASRTSTAKGRAACIWSPFSRLSSHKLSPRTTS